MTLRNTVCSNLDGVKNKELNLRIKGSKALDLAYVAAGRLDGFFQKNLIFGT